jgi:hypothetical protein
MADDYAGLKAAITAFLAAAPGDKGIFGITDAAELRKFQQLAALFKQKAADQGITL